VTYELVRHAGPGDFLQRAESWLLASEAEHNLHLSLAYVRRDAGATGADVLFGTVEQDGDLVGCVIRTPPHKLLITSMPPEAAPDIVGPVAELYDEIPAVLGPADSAVAVASAWTALKGGGWETGMQQRIYRLDQVEPVRPVPGAMRLATMDDLELLTDWGTGFARDAGHVFLLAREQVNRMIERQDPHIWQDESPASMAVAQGATPNGCRVGYVYTPPELRGRRVRFGAHRTAEPAYARLWNDLLRAVHGPREPDAERDLPENRIQRDLRRAGHRHRFRASLAAVGDLS